jgi:hypothetical protein
MNPSAELDRAQLSGLTCRCWVDTESWLWCDGRTLRERQQAGSFPADAAMANERRGATMKEIFVLPD